MTQRWALNCLQLESVQRWETYFYKCTTEPKDFQQRAAGLTILRNERDENTEVQRRTTR